MFGTNTTSDISKLLYVISRAVRRVKFEKSGIYAKYHVQIMQLFVYSRKYGILQQAYHILARQESLTRA